MLGATRPAASAWEPKNYDGKFEGPMRLRTALAKSKNLVSVRVLQAIGPQYAQDYITPLRLRPRSCIRPISRMALGAGSATPLQMVAALLRVRQRRLPVAPYLIAKVVDARGNVAVARRSPIVAGENAERAIDPRNAFIMTTLLQDVIALRHRRRARMSLGRKDLAGKTGTTNDYVDAWFCGYNAELVGVAWIGFDQPKTLGNNETGGVGRAADLDRLHGEGR